MGLKAVMTFVNIGLQQMHGPKDYIICIHELTMNASNFLPTTSFQKTITARAHHQQSQTTASQPVMLQP